MAARSSFQSQSSSVYRTAGRSTGSHRCSILTRRSPPWLLRCSGSAEDWLRRSEFAPMKGTTSGAKLYSDWDSAADCGVQTGEIQRRARGATRFCAERKVATFELGGKQRMRFPIELATVRRVVRGPRSAMSLGSLREYLNSYSLDVPIVRASIGT